MSTTLLLAILLAIAAIAYVLGRMRAHALSGGKSSALHSRANYYCASVALAAFLPPLILVGTMNAVSSGLLVFAALIELLSEDFLSDQSWTVLRGRKRVAACCLVLFGSICMSLVGAWA